MPFHDKEAPVAHILRALGIDEDSWRRFVEGFDAECALGKECLAQRIAVLKQLWHSMSPHEPPPDNSIAYDRRCPVCGASRVDIVATRRQSGDFPLVYGACGDCGLGILLRRSAEGAMYNQPEYYLRRGGDRAGYENYLAERHYRVTKGRRLIEWMLARAARPLRTLLEIGSGFGFTRAAGEQLGFATRGVDLNPCAAQIAQAIYGFDTFSGTLADALDTKAISAGSADAILYQFVLEHLENPEDELRVASQALSQHGVLMLVVPNMQSVEREIFGASYRSFRRDHLWLFSPSSLNILFKRAGLRIIAMESECNVGLLRPFLTDEELEQLNAGCRAADLLVIAEKKRGEEKR